MGNYYSVQVEEIFPDMYDKNEFVDVQPNYDPKEIFHPSAFDDITTHQYERAIQFYKQNKYVYCHKCNKLTMFVHKTRSGRLTHPSRDTIVVSDDILCIECDHCYSTIKSKI